MLSRKPDCRIHFDVTHFNIHRIKSPVGVRHYGGARETLFLSSLRRLSILASLSRNDEIKTQACSTELLCNQFFYPYFLGDGVLTVAPA